jgi:hypothetical protein
MIKKSQQITFDNKRPSSSANVLLFRFDDIKCWRKLLMKMPIILFPRIPPIAIVM